MIIEVADCCLFSFFRAAPSSVAAIRLNRSASPEHEVSPMGFLNKREFCYLLFYIYTILPLYGRQQANPFSYIEYFQLSLYLIFYYQTKQGWILVHPYQDYIYNRLLGNDGATRWLHALNFVDGFLAAASHSDGLNVATALEYPVVYVGDIARVPTA